VKSVDDCELPPREIDLKTSNPPLMSWLPILRRQEVAEAAGPLVVVAVLGIRRVEVGLAELAQRQEEADARRIELDVLAGPAVALELELLARVLQRGEEVRRQHAVVRADDEVRRIGRLDERARLDREAERLLDQGLLGVRVGPLQGVVLEEVRGQLRLVPRLLVGGVEGLVGDVEGVLVGRLEVAAGAEEPEPVGDELPAERAGVDLVGLVRVGDAVLLLVGRQRLPVVVGQVDPRAAVEVVASGLGHRVDDAAREAAVLGGDARGQDLGLLDRLLDDEAVGGGPEEVVVDVDAVHQPDVVVGQRARHLNASVRRLIAHVRRERDDLVDAPADRELVDLGLLVGRGMDRRLVHLLGGAEHRDLGGRGRRHRRVRHGRAADGERRVTRHRLHAGDLEVDLVVAGRQELEEVFAGRAGDDRTRPLLCGRGDRDVDAGEAGAVRQLDGAGERSRLDALPQRHRARE